MERVSCVAKLALVLALGAALVAAPGVSLKMRYGNMGTAPAVVRFQSTIEHDARNRVWCLEWASADAAGRTCQDFLSPADERPRTIWRDVTFQVGGEYAVVARLQKNDETWESSNVITVTIQDRYGR